MKERQKKVNACTGEQIKNLKWSKDAGGLLQLPGHTDLERLIRNKPEENHR